MAIVISEISYEDNGAKMRMAYLGTDSHLTEARMKQLSFLMFLLVLGGCTTASECTIDVSSALRDVEAEIEELTKSVRDVSATSNTVELARASARDARLEILHADAKTLRRLLEGGTTVLRPKPRPCKCCCYVGGTYGECMDESECDVVGGICVKFAQGCYR